MQSRTKLVFSQIVSSLDYCIILLLGASDRDIRPLKLVLNKAVRFVYGLKFRSHITPHYKTLNLLPIPERIIFKSCVIAHKIFYNRAPNYLINNFTKFKRTTKIDLRTSTGRDELMFEVNLNSHKSNSLLERMKISWNSLPYELRKLESIFLFKAKLKCKLLLEL